MSENSERPQGTDSSQDTDWRSHIAPAMNLEEFPFEPGERVWVLKTGYRAPLGPFTIHRVLPDNMFELKEEATGTVQPEAVDGAFLKREPF